jgi:hypothetical protein
VSVDRLISGFQSVKAELVTQAEKWASFTTEVVSTDPKAWDARTIARKELESELACALRIPERTAQVPTKLPRLIRYRDGTCRAPGCGAPARKAEIDHLNDWAAGGGTDYDNLYCLCPKHHK